MNSQTKTWIDPFIAFMLLTNVLLGVHFFHYGISTEQSAQILAVLLFYAWLSQWMKKA